MRIEYGRQCVRLEPAHGGDGALTGWLATLADDSTIACRYLGHRGRPRRPHTGDLRRAPVDRVIHSTSFEAGTASMDPDTAVPDRGDRRRPERGGNAVGAPSEVPEASLTMVMRSIGLANYATSSFTNELYFPSFTDEFYAAPVSVREQVLAQMHGTNYSGLTRGCSTRSTSRPTSSG